MKGKNENEVLRKALCLAILMLVETKVATRTIAQVCGFGSTYKMTKQFIKEFERTPTQVRKLFDMLPQGWGHAYEAKVQYALGKITYFDSIYLGPGFPYQVQGEEGKQLIKILMEANPHLSTDFENKIMVISSDTGRKEGRAIVTTVNGAMDVVGTVRIKYTPFVLEA